MPSDWRFSLQTALHQRQIVCVLEIRIHAARYHQIMMNRLETLKSADRYSTQQVYMRDGEKSIRKLKVFVMILAIISVFACASAAFAIGETIVHNGTATQGYTTSQYVRQLSDNRLRCRVGYTDRYSCTVYPSNSSGTRIESAATSGTLRAGTVLYIPDAPSIRSVYLRVNNSPAGYSITSHGEWVLEA